MKTDKLILFLLSVIFMHILSSEKKFCFGQKEKTIQGRIIDPKNNQPIPAVSVAVLSTGKGTVSNNNGYFILQVPSDTLTLMISSVGYKKKILKLDSKSEISNIDVQLEEDVINLDEVTVVCEKERIARVSENISSVKMSPKLVAKLPNMGEVDVIRSFQLLPGVSASNETSAGLYVRGGTPDQNLILFDGMTIYHVDHFYGFFSAFNANTIDDIELIKGGFPAKYGGRIASVMEITGRDADLNKVKVTGNMSLLSVNGAIEVPIIKQRLSLQVAARRSYTDIIRTGLYNKIFDLYSDDEQTGPSAGGSGRMGGMRGFEVEEQQPRFYFYDFNSKLNYIVSNKHTLSLSFYNGKDNLDNSRDLSSNFSFGGTSSTNSSSTTDIAGWGNTGVSAKWKADWGPKFSSTLFYSNSKYFSNRDRNSSMSNSSEGTNRETGTLEENIVKDQSIRLRNQWFVNKNNTIEFGIENTANDITYSLTFNDTLNMVDRNDKGTQTAVYMLDKISLYDNKLEMNLGLRTTYQNITDVFYYEPRIAISYQLVKGLKLKSAWGNYYQLCSRVIREDVLEGSKDFWLLADGSTIPVSSSMHYILGMSYEIGNFLLDVEAYYKTLDGLVEYSLRTTNSFRITSTQEEYFYKGDGYAKGIEFLVQKKYGLNTGWIAYTLSEVKHTFPDLNYGNSYYASHDQPHELKTIYTRKIKNFDLSATFIYATGKPYTAPESEYQLTLLDGSTYNYIHVSDKNSLRLPDYHRLDLSLSYTWQGIKADKSISLSVFNVYNHTNIWYKEYTISEDQVTVTYVNYLGFTPNVSFSIRLK